MIFRMFFYLLTVLLILINYSYASDSDAFYDIAHEKISKGFIGISRQIDRFFAGPRADDMVNNSQIRLISISTKSENPGVFTEARLRLNLVLPGTQDKLQVIIEGQGNNNNQNNQLNNTTQTDDATTNNTNVQNTTTAAFRFITDFLGVKASADSGIRLNIPPKVFGRLRFWTQYEFKNKWLFRPRQEFFVMQEEGFQSTLNLDFDKNIANKKLLFRFINRMFWNDQDNILLHTNGPILFQTIDDKKGLSYQISAISEQTETTKVINYITRVSYRQLLYQNWLFGEISPQIEFPRSENFHRTPSISVRFEVVMGSI